MLKRIFAIALLAFTATACVNQEQEGLQEDCLDGNDNACALIMQEREQRQQTIQAITRMGAYLSTPPAQRYGIAVP